MANIFEIPQINPLKLYQQIDIINTIAYTQSSYAAYNPNLNDLGIDKDFMYRQLKSYMDKDRYWQPFQQGDVIRLQWLGNDDYVLPLVAYDARIIDCNGVIIKEVDATVGSAVGSLYIREIELPLYDVPEGKYFIQIQKVGYLTDYDFWMISEGIEVKQTHPNTMLLEYSNTSNDQGIFYETGIEFQFRIHAAFAELTTGSKFNVYDDQPMNLKLLSGVPYREWMLQFGIADKPFPNWVLDKLERIFLSDLLYIENELYTRSEGAKLEPIRVDKNPLMQATITVRPQSNDCDTYVSQYPNIVLGTALDDDFYVTILSQTSPATSVVIGLGFTNARNFVDYLNSVDPLAIVDKGNTYFAINNGRIVLRTNNSTVNTAYSPGLTYTSYNYCLKVRILATATETDLIIDVNNPAASTKYAYVWGDGTKATGSGLVHSITKTYTDGDHYTANIFMNQCENLDLSLSDNIIQEIGGKLATKLITFTCENQPLKVLKENIFNVTDGYLNTVSLGLNSLTTASINANIINIFDADLLGCFDATATIDLAGQTPLAPHSESAGLSYMKATLLTNGITITTD